MGTRTENHFCGTTLLAGSPRPLIPMPTHRLPHNAGKASKDTQAQPFPSALGGPFAAPLFAPLSAMRNSLWMRLQLYFRLKGLSFRFLLLNYSFVRLSRTFFLESRILLPYSPNCDKIISNFSLSRCLNQRNQLPNYHVIARSMAETSHATWQSPARQQDTVKC